ncbi:PREDICTED: uncharacterized protein LOC109158877 isoform X2 [Ipomoea nil]|uniref:uncharacterized protein LOC109158877 isoform X2 n=1 Tax=Ipomoea nil TaxID=35883 RepID=UPI0009009355|nr:PREDICTED: uncharacterized protein LOC109158877 isoform X2 [Ipomoea nil]
MHQPPEIEVVQKEEREETTLIQQQSRRPNLSSLQIPARSSECDLTSFTRIDVPSPGSARAGLPPRPNSARLISSVKNLIPQKSFRAKNLPPDAEKTVLIVPETPLSDKPSTSRSFSLNKILFSSSTKPAHSLPVTPKESAAPKPFEDSQLDDHSELPIFEVQHIPRSFSVPANVKNKSLKRIDSSGNLIRVISSSARRNADSDALPDTTQEIENATDDNSEDIPEEEAICRICFVELGEGGEAFKMECSCKGELALVHKECILKWFSIKGNKLCDVCKQEVRNLPVTLLKIQNPSTAVRRPTTGSQQREPTRYRVLQDVPILVMVSMLAYFCFLEQLLVSDMGARALAFSLPFSCVLGFVSSMIASTMVSKSYIWAYASFQFAIVILFAHIFYAVLNVSAILSVMLSSFTGFGIAISTNSLLVEYLRWRASRRLHSSPENTRNESTLQQDRHNHNHPVQSA